MIEIKSPSTQFTFLVGQILGHLVQEGDLILVSGDLGSGKTVFAQGVAKGMGIIERVSSPTFTLMHIYQGPIVLLHADLYRLEYSQEVIDLGIMETLDEGAVGLIEWGDVASEVFPPDFLAVDIFIEEDETRRIEFRSVGTNWTKREQSLKISLDDLEKEPKQ